MLTDAFLVSFAACVFFASTVQVFLVSKPVTVGAAVQTALLGGSFAFLTQGLRFDLALDACVARVGGSAKSGPGAGGSTEEVSNAAQWAAGYLFAVASRMKEACG